MLPCPERRAESCPPRRPPDGVAAVVRPLRAARPAAGPAWVRLLDGSPPAATRRGPGPPERPPDDRCAGGFAAADGPLAPRLALRAPPPPVSLPATVRRPAVAWPVRELEPPSRLARLGWLCPARVGCRAVLDVAEPPPSSPPPAPRAVLPRRGRAADDEAGRGVVLRVLLAPGQVGIRGMPGRCPSARCIPRPAPALWWPALRCRR